MPRHPDKNQIPFLLQWLIAVNLTCIFFNDIFRHFLPSFVYLVWQPILLCWPPFVFMGCEIQGNDNLRSFLRLVDIAKMRRFMSFFICESFWKTKQYILISTFCCWCCSTDFNGDTTVLWVTEKFSIPTISLQGDLWYRLLCTGMIFTFAPLLSSTFITGGAIC